MQSQYFVVFCFLNLFIEIKKYINHYKFKIAKKSVYNFATLRLIAYNDNMKVPTHITK
jgi:hypothetical protein